MRRQDARHDIGLFGHRPVWSKLAGGLFNLIFAGAVSTQVVDVVCGLDWSDIFNRGSGQMGCHYQAAIRNNRLIHSIHSLNSFSHMVESIAN